MLAPSFHLLAAPARLARQPKRSETKAAAGGRPLPNPRRRSPSPAVPRVSAVAEWVSELPLETGEVTADGGEQEEPQATGAVPSAANDIASLLAEATAAMKAYTDVDKAAEAEGIASTAAPVELEDDPFALPASAQSRGRSVRARAPKAPEDLADFVVLPRDERGALAHLPRSFAALMRVSMTDLHAALREAGVPALGHKGDIAEAVLVARGELPLYQRPLRAMGIDELRHVARQADVDLDEAGVTTGGGRGARTKAAKEEARMAALAALLEATETRGLALNTRELAKEVISPEGAARGAGKALQVVAAEAEAARVAAVRKQGLPVSLAVRGTKGAGAGVARRRRSKRALAGAVGATATGSGSAAGARRRGVAAMAVAPSPSVADRRPLTAAEEEQASKIRSALAQQSNDPIKAFMTEVSNDGLLTSQEEVELSQGIGELVRLRKARFRACRAEGLLPKGGPLDENGSARGPRAREANALRDVAFERLDHQSWADEAELSVEEVLSRWEHGTRCRERMVMANQRLVFSLAKRYQGQGLTLEDLIIEGTFGLIKGAEKYDGSKGFKFSTYATWWVRQAITRALADQGRTIRLPVHLVELLHRVNRVKREEIERNGVEPSIAWLADQVGVTVAKLENLMSAATDTMSLDQEIGGRGGGGSSASYNGGRAQTIMDQAVTEDAHAQNDGDGGTLNMLMREDIETVLNTLTPRERDVMRLRYGLADGVSHTLEDIGDEFSLTRERIRQIEAKAIRKLRQPFRSRPLLEYVQSNQPTPVATPAFAAQQRRKITDAVKAGQVPEAIAVPKRGRGRPRKDAKKTDT